MPQITIFTGGMFTIPKWVMALFYPHYSPSIKRFLEFPCRSQLWKRSGFCRTVQVYEGLANAEALLQDGTYGRGD